MAENINRGYLEEHELEAVERGAKIHETGIQKNKSSRKKYQCVANGRQALGNHVSENPRAYRIVFLILLNIVVFSYFAYATVYWIRNNSDCEFEWCDGYGMLLLLFAFTYFGIFYFCIFKRYVLKYVKRTLRPFGRSLKRLRARKRTYFLLRTAFYISVLAAAIVFLILDTINDRDRLISCLGVIVLIGLGWIFSKHPTQINWQPVLWGLILQFSFGLLTIRWTVGRIIFQCVSNKIETFMNYSIDGASFVFSNELVNVIQVFAFAALPVIFFFSFFIYILSYLGVMQWVIMRIGWVLHLIMDTTICESMNTAANVFLSMSESPLLIQSYIHKLTVSEMHAIMASGFATVSGTVLAAYISFGAQPAHLITASLMSAPAALCYSKLFYPETEESQTTVKNIVLEKSEDSSLIDAAVRGAMAGIPLVLSIVANIVAFISFVSFINAILSWLGGLIGNDSLSFELILSKLFMPLSWVMGVPWEQCEYVSTLIGLKTAVNEFVAYQKLGVYKKEGVLSARTEAIATYAICGFANPGSVGIMIGALTVIAPEKRDVIVGVAFRSFITGSAVCFLTACIAGMLINEDYYSTISSSTNSTTTVLSILSQS
ncbi:solute carrier family 28 member 3 isoform X1 [Cephus cinctus]|uniref:Sodium/nucleoside cotransporter n=2 Tax=Cephus cinctus TaxID=211228 RepID=A0AAJ7RJ99_CEPCN|nr:solute carrier family 28 member 3 isoform X1 [Cephus cinctus]XP_015597751.1 solute carrier family 28 member 3 isoform X1 [Cephus cinctus]XP_024941936.1 solute carrier family 28 member 3 isoform X1 [Cephus cinctus]XP_024941937.1 solute carrier family 28 member 3 isoform X1 [Cephus cinctus]XP_024941938.1 solute carrier family 28 member 3 isoform X1 [Cephus cinctus]